MENEVKNENKKGKELLIAALVFVVVLLLAALVYFVFIKKDKSTNTEEKQIIQEKVTHISLTSEDQEVSIRGKKVNLKVINSTLFINDVSDSDHADIGASGGVFVTNNYALIAETSRNGIKIDYAISEEGEIINVYKSMIADTAYTDYELSNVRADNGKVVADYLHEECVESADNSCNSKVEFVYYDERDYLVAREINIKDNKKPLTKFELTDSDLIIDFNDTTAKIRAELEESSKIYLNNKLIKEFDNYGSLSAYVSDNMIFIVWPGAQCDTLFIGAINEDGEYVEVDNQNSYPVYGFYSQNGIVMGTGYECIMTEENTDFNAKFSYDGEKIKLTKVE